MERLRIWKTKDYYELNKFGNRRDPEGYPQYFGHHKGVEDAWMPHGDGEHYYNGKKIFEGHFLNGLEHGKGSTEIWTGGFAHGKMDGTGLYKGREAMVRRSQIICFQDELTDGKCIEFYDRTMRVPHLDAPVRANILCHIKGWRYKMRFHEEAPPQTRSIDLATLVNFEKLPFRVRHDLPSVYTLDRFGIETDSPNPYKFWEEAYGQKGRPRLGAVGGRRVTQPSDPHGVKVLMSGQRTKTKFKENVFEPRAVGIGEALEQANAEYRMEQKRKQWSKLIDERRAAEEEEKRKEVAAEQEQQMQAQLQAQREKALKNKAEDDAAAERDRIELERIKSEQKEELEKEEAESKAYGF